MSQTKKYSTSQHTRPVTQPVVVTVGEKRWVVGGDESVATVRSYDPYAYPPPPSDSNLPDDSATVEDEHRTAKVRPGASIFERLAEVTDYLFHEVHEGRRPHTPYVKRSPGFRATGAVRRKGRRLLRETFQVGCMFGLLLGCLSLILFHQMEPNTLPKTAPSTAVNPVSVASAGPALAVPSIKLYVLQAGPFSTEQNAQATQLKLARQGYSSTLHQEGGKLDLWLSLSVTPAGLKSTAAALAKQGVQTSVRALSWKVHSVPGVPGANALTMQQASHWLSSAASSLTALTATLANGGQPQDATTAFSVTNSLIPNADQLRDTGRDQLLTALSTDLRSAFSAYSEHHPSASMQGLLKVAGDLAQLQ